MVSADEVLLEVKDLRKYFPVRRGIFFKIAGYIKAVDSVSFYIKKGETLGLVGESGCGKSTTGFSIARLEEATSGKVNFLGKNILSMNAKELMEIRKEIQFIFQDPYSSLNPRMTVVDIIGEPLIIHKLVKNKKEKVERVKQLLNDVGLNIRQMHSFPHEFSGGQRQRIGIARALGVEPKLIIADEPVSALDVSIQAQVINLLVDLQNKFGLAFLFISHDLSVVKHISDRVAVMYLGKIVEMAAEEEIFSNPLHPYTQSLLSAVPIPNPHIEKERIILKGDVPSPINPPSGCRFHPRCPKAMEACQHKIPEMTDYGNQHFVTCHLV